MIVRDLDKIELKIGGRSVALQATYGGAINEAEDLILVATDFDTEDNAVEFGNRIRNALLAASARAPFGMDVGRDKSSLNVSAAVKKAIFDVSGHIQRNNVHGLMVYPSEPHSTFLHSSASGIFRQDPSEFFASLASSFDEKYEIDESLRTANDLYCSCCMEKSPTAKFIMAFAAIEKMTEGSERPEGEMKLIEKAIKLVNDEDALKDDKKMVLDLIKNGKKISKGRAARNLIKKYLPDEIQLFKKLSKFRGEIAHPSKIENRDELPEMASQAQRIAALLIECRLQATKEESAASPS